MLLIPIIAAVVLASAAEGEPTGAIAQAHATAQEGAVWRSATRTERQLVQRTVALMLAGAERCSSEGMRTAGRSASLVHMVVAPIHEGGAWLLSEKEGHRRGAGIVVVRCGPAAPVVLSAPHSLHDVHTGTLATQLFVEHEPRALLLNTIHRHGATKDELPGDPSHPADSAHETGSLLHAATLAVAAEEGLRMVQFHGFADQDEHTVIVSSGSVVSALSRLATGLAELGAVGAYGASAWELGGTTNVAAPAFPHGRFAHVALGRGVRDVLVEDEALRLHLWNGLIGPW
jgi:hypothetical protein